MSTEIGEIKGRVEGIPYSKIDYVDSAIHLNRFFGGQKNGAMLQITAPYPGYIQLTKEQVKELIVMLQNSFDYDKYPSE